MTFATHGPITAERAQLATEWLVENAPHIARLKGQRDRAEHMIKVARAFAFEASEGTVAAREHAALRSEKYMEAIEAHTQAVIEHETALGTRKAAETLVDVWKSLNANMRISERGF